MQRLIARFQTEDESGTHGILTTENCQFICHLLTLKWRDNNHGDWTSGSCIPPGTYTCVPHKWSENPDQPTWEITDVEGRDGILIHPANVIQQLKGCIAPGTGLGKFFLDDNGKISNTDTSWKVDGVTGSKDAMKSIALMLGNGEVQAGYDATFKLWVINDIIPAVA